MDKTAINSPASCILKIVTKFQVASAAATFPTILAIAAAIIYVAGVPIAATVSSRAIIAQKISAYIIRFFAAFLALNIITSLAISEVRHAACLLN